MATIGAGPDQPHLTPLLAALPADRLRHLTWVTDQELPDLYRGANLFVMPNIEVPGDIEGFGLVALEAAANGTFTVGSDVSGVNEAVVEGTTGMLLPPGDAKRYVEVIADFTQVPEKAEELGRLAEDFAHRECSWARTALAYQDSLFPPVDRSVEPFPAPGRGARPS
jgi:glycosyltransferase involved in cell wall biosynthesis